MKTIHLNSKVSSQKRIIISLFFVFCISVIVICTLMYKVFSEKLADDLYTRAKEVIDVIDYMAHSSGESPVLVKGVKTLAASRDIKLIIIRTDNPPEIIASNKHALIGLQTNQIFSNSEGVRSFQFDPKTDQYTAISSIWLGNKLNNGRLIKASVGIIFDTSKIRLHLQEQILNTSFALILTMICALGIVYFITNKYIFKPLKIINSSLIKNKSDKEYSPIPIISADELGCVAMTLNQVFTDLYQSEKKLRLHIERYDLTPQDNVGLVDWNIITDEIFCSSSLRQMLGIDAKDFNPSMKWFESRIHKEDQELAHTALISHIKYDTEYDIEGRLRHEDGHYVWLRARGQAVRDETGKATRMVGYYLNVSKRKANEHFMNSLYLVGADATISLDSKINKILKEGLSYLNLQCSAIFKIVNEKCITQYIQCHDVCQCYENFQIEINSKFDLKDTLCESVVKQNDIVAIHDVAKSELKDVRAHTQDGINSYIGIPIHIHGRIYGTLNFFGKNTMPKAFDEREKSFVRLISQWVGNEFIRAQYIDFLHDTEIQLEKAVNQLTDSNAELENFVYVASHDLQEPLRMITNFTGLLEKNYANQLDDTAKEYIKISSSAACEMRELIKGLLHYAYSSRDSVKVENIDLNEILNDVSKILDAQIKESNAKLIFQKLPVIKANKVCMISLLQNLISNAIKFQPKSNQPIVEIKVSNQMSKWVIAVIDNGIGINYKYTSKIFEPFKRLHTKSEYSGTGIGLAVCKKIVDRMGGTMWVDSEIGLGSTFYITVSKLATQTGKAA